MTMTNTNCATASHATVAPRISVLAKLMQARGLWRQRQQLKSLDKAILKDIGVTRDEALREAERSIWDAPASWTR